MSADDPPAINPVVRGEGVPRFFRHLHEFAARQCRSAVSAPVCTCTGTPWLTLLDATNPGEEGDKITHKHKEHV